jgi:hypothetical protein
MFNQAEQPDRAPNENEKPENCYCPALPRGLTCVCPAIRNGSGSERQRPGKLTTCPRRLVSSRGICWASPPPLRIERFRRCSLPALQ